MRLLRRHCCHVVCSLDTDYSGNDGPWKRMVMIAPTLNVPASYAAFIDGLIDVMRLRDGTQWLCGDMLKDIEMIYAECTMQMIADQIGRQASTLYSWRDLAAFFAPPLREHYTQRGLWFSHFKEAYRLGTLDAACAFLDDCVLNVWTTRQAADEARALAGKSPRAERITGLVTFRRERGAWVMVGLQGVKEGVSYKVTIEEIK
jgi:hypothetical protein